MGDEEGDLVGGSMTTTQCPHHWIIETPDGPVSNGRCKLCGEEKEFNNSMGITENSWTTRPQGYLKVPQSEVEDD